MTTAIARYTTLNSTYEVDMQGKRIRRLSGVNEPTPSLEADGLWQTFEAIDRIGKPGFLIIQWPEGAKARSHTITSQITAETYNTVEETQ